MYFIWRVFEAFFSCNNVKLIYGAFSVIVLAKKKRIACSRAKKVPFHSCLNFGFVVKIMDNKSTH